MKERRVSVLGNISLWGIFVLAVIIGCDTSIIFSRVQPARLLCILLVFLCTQVYRHINGHTQRLNKAGVIKLYKKMYNTNIYVSFTIYNIHLAVKCINIIDFCNALDGV